MAHPAPTAFWGDLHRFSLIAPYNAVVSAADAAVTLVAESVVSASGACREVAVGLLLPYARAAGAYAAKESAWVPYLIALALLLLAWSVYYPPRLLFDWLSRRYRGVLFHFRVARKTGNDPQKFVALTIDDGPCPYNTLSILEALRAHGAKATHFVIGSHVEQCDRVGAGIGRVQFGRILMRQMLLDGHELGNHTWYDRPSHKLTLEELEEEVYATGQLMHEARCAYKASMPQEHADAPAFRHRRWFRPGHGLWTSDMVALVRRMGYQLALGSIWPYDTLIHLPLLNALYVWSKVYTGGVIVLHDRRRHTAETLSWLLPWLAWCGYRVVSLSEAQALAGASMLTDEALAEHNQAAVGSQRAASGSSEPAGGGAGADALAAMMMLTAEERREYEERVTQERERQTEVERGERDARRRNKEAERAARDRRAGIDRRLADMSAAEKRAMERKERERRAAEKRRAERKAEEIRAREQYALYRKQQKASEARRAEEAEKSAAAAKAREEAAAKHKERQDAERAYARKMLEELRAKEREANEQLRKKNEEEAAARAAAAAEAYDDDDDADADAAAAAGGKAGAKGLLLGKLLGGGRGSSGALDAGTGDGAGRKKGLLGKLRFKGIKQVHDEGTAAAAGAAAGAATAAAAAAAAVAVAGPEPLMHHASVVNYGWYGLPVPPGSERALGAIAASLEAQAAPGAQVPTAPAFGEYARSASGRPLLGFDGAPLLLAESGWGARVALRGDGSLLTGPSGEGMSLVLDTAGRPLVDPHGRPIMVAEGEAGEKLGTHPDGSIIVDRSGRAARVALGPDGLPLLGTDNRPLIVATDAEGGPWRRDPTGP